MHHHRRRAGSPLHLAARGRLHKNSALHSRIFEGIWRVGECCIHLVEIMLEEELMSVVEGDELPDVAGLPRKRRTARQVHRRPRHGIGHSAQAD